MGTLADELDGVFPIARYQQRGISPSVETGPRDVDAHVRDAVAVMDALGWAKAVVIGHSWGGHLAMHLAVARPERLRAFVSIDPLGAVGDGGMAEFVTTLSSQVPVANRERFAELEALDTLTEDERREHLRMLWPFYFGDPGHAPPFPEFSFDMQSGETWSSIKQHFEAGTLESGLPRVDVPFLLIHGEESPLPIAEARRTAALTANGRLVAVPGTGHWPWIERPGLVRVEIERFVGELKPAG
jgi:pimeloyl-ACP methyl ester carboxylesterase